MKEPKFVCTPVAEMMADKDVRNYDHVIWSFAYETETESVVNLRSIFEWNGEFFTLFTSNPFPTAEAAASFIFNQNNA